MRRLAAVAVVAFALMPAATAQSPVTEPTHRIAVVLRVPLFATFVDVDGRTVVPRRDLDAMAQALGRWTEPPLDGVPLSLALSPALCDALGIVNVPEARRIHATLKQLAARADVLTVPYADVWLPYLANAGAVEEQLTLGRETLRACLGTEPAGTLFAHVLHTAESEPTSDVDGEAIAAARRAGVDHVVAQGITQTPVRSEEMTIVPFTDALALNEDGSVREPADVTRFAVIADARRPDGFGAIGRLVQSESAALVRVGGLAVGAPSVTVAFADDPAVPRRTRDVVTLARDAVDAFVGVTREDNPLRTRLRVAYAEALALASKDAEVQLELGDRRDAGGQLARRIDRFVEKQLRRVTLSEGEVTFTSRRGAVPVTVANRTAYPVRVRVSVSSPKLTFPNGRTRVVTIEPPGDTITFEAFARSTGTFPTLALVKSRNGTVTIDSAELTVRSTATNLSALILTGGGAIFLLVFLVRRVGRRRAADDEGSGAR